MNEWMKNIPDNIRISDINIPGTHDSCSKNIRLSYFSKCHDSSIPEQLNMGIRYLDIRLEKVDGKLKTVHGIVDCYTPSGNREKLLFDRVLEDCTAFLKKNPSEAVMLSIKRDDGVSSEETFDTFFENYAEQNHIWYRENRIPELGEVRGKIVLLNRCSADANNDIYTDMNVGINLSSWPDQSKLTDSAFSTVSIPRRNKKSTEKYYLQDMYKLSPSKKWSNAILPLLEAPPEGDGIIFNFFSANDSVHSPRICAKYIFKRFNDYDLIPLRKYGWLIFDFPTENLCRKVVLTNFKKRGCKKT